jgi:hypothetical protein
MSAANSDRVKQLFQAAPDQPPPHQRAAYLREACGADRTVQEEIESRLGDARAGSRFAEHPEVELSGAVASGRVLHAGDRLGADENVVSALGLRPRSNPRSSRNSGASSSNTFA